MMIAVEANPRTVILTGGTGGLGRAAGEAMTAAGWNVIAPARDRLDLASLRSVRDFAAALEGPLDAIVCNAGLQLVGPTTFTEDGFETTFQVNHLAHFLLVALLRDRLAPDARVMVVSSGTHDPDRRTGMPAPSYVSAEQLARPVPSDLPAEGRRRYTTSKLCNVLFAYELARRAPLAANAFDPGLMPGTGLARDYRPFQKLVWDRVLPALTRVAPNLNTTEQSGRALARLVTDPALRAVTGAYFLGQRPRGSSIASYDRDKARDLWETSERLMA
jgi:NAD(P)-dependent dehydrogenase (short-subunit alcohol dehydrogenase family)